MSGARYNIRILKIAGVSSSKLPLFSGIENVFIGFKIEEHSGALLRVQSFQEYHIYYKFLILRLIRMVWACSRPFEFFTCDVACNTPLLLFIAYFADIFDIIIRHNTLGSKGSLVRFPAEAYIIILEFWLMERCSHLGEDHTNEIKHDIHPE